MVKLITTNSQFNIFPLLVKQLKEPCSLTGKNVVFCEEKISLYVERFICNEFSGTFNTSVYSFGNYLRAKKTIPNVLTKEGASMAIKGIVKECELKRLNKSRQTLAPSLFELIIQLKSASVTPTDLKNSLIKASGVLKEKLLDVCEVYSKYEEFLATNEYVDQSQMLSFLPQEIESSNELDGANVVIVGYAGFTAQIRQIISSIIKKASCVTAILCEGDNQYAFVNETKDDFIEICAKMGVAVQKTYVPTLYQEQAESIVKYLFNPKAYLLQPKKAENVKLIKARSAYEEMEIVASQIKKLVLEGKCKYKDVAVCVPSIVEYAEKIRSAFYSLEVPYFLDEKKCASSHPLVKLILSYIEVFRKNFERKTLKAFYSNPYFNLDKNLSDAFYNYCLKYDVNFSAIKRQFSLSPDLDSNLEDLENFRKQIVSFFEKFDVKNLLERLDVKNKCVLLAHALTDMGQTEESAISMQIYSAVMGVLSEMNKILPQINTDLNEFKAVFTSGVLAIELSIIPQYNDAVFIGGFKEVALGQAKHVFAVGLVDGVPSVQEDGALLCDSDIDELEKFKVLVEPKIQIVNKRAKENLTLALTSFSQSLTLSYPLVDDKNVQTKESDVITIIMGSIFEPNVVEDFDEFTTRGQALKTFSRECGEFALGKDVDFCSSSSFYKAEKDGKNKRLIQSILDRANKEVKFRLQQNKQVLLNSVKSPTSIEDYNKCPYRAFLTRALRIVEQDVGGYSPRLLGNFMHDIFSEYAKNLNRITDEESSKKIFDSIKDEMLKKQDYCSLTEGEENAQTCNRALLECEKFCYKTYEWIKSGEFTINRDDLEVKFGEGAKYQAISLLGGDVKISGKIDRIDSCGDFFRVVDYKTGKASLDSSEIFSGKKLQLFLYANAIKDKRLVGAYYVPVSDEYVKKDAKKKTYAIGKTDGDEEVLKLQDKDFFDKKSNEYIPAHLDKSNCIKGASTKEQMSAFSEYAIKISEKAVENMADGVIVASPLKDECKYCAFKAMCEVNVLDERKIKEVDDDTIYQAVMRDKDNKDKNE